MAQRKLDLGSHHTAAIMENIEFLRKNGMSDEAIAKRLGLKINSMRRKEDRHGEPDSASA